MTTEHDPVLHSLFDDAEQQLDDAQFTGAVAERIEWRRRRLLLGRIAIVAAIVLLDFALESPLVDSLGQAAEVLGRELIPVGSGWFAFFVSPLNSIAGLIGMTLLGINLLYRRIAY